jgi:hypothetical protein
MIMANIFANEAGEASQVLVRSSGHDEAHGVKETGNGNAPAIKNNTTRTSSVPNPLLGSIMDAIQKAGNRHILVHTLFWVPDHLAMLRVRFRISDTLDWQQLFLPYADLGKVPRRRLALVLHYPYCTERDENLTGLVQETVFSFQQRLRKPIFNIKYR